MEIRNRFSEGIQTNVVQGRSVPHAVNKRDQRSLKEFQVKVGFPLPVL